MAGWTTDNFETGLLDDFDFTIERAWFAVDSRYNNGETVLLQWEGKTDDADTPETHVWFPLGKGWSSEDGGKTIVHDSGKPDKYFVKTSLMAKLIARVVDDFGLGDLLETRGDPFTASVWPGLTFHMKSETIDFGGGGIEARPKVFPQKFVGVVDEAGTKPKAAAKPAAKSGGASALLAAAAAKKAAASAAPLSLTDQVKAAMAPHKANDDFASAQQAALELPGVAEDEEIINRLLDDGEGSIYAEV